MKELAVIYGAGGNCWTFLTIDEKYTPYIVHYIVDKDPQKWGTQIGNIEIKEVASLGKHDYDILIIALQEWKSVAEEICAEYEIDEKKVYIYDVWNEPRLQSLSEANLGRTRKQIDIMTAQLGVFNELLSEAYNDREFETYNEITVYGRYEYYDFIKNWFGIMNPNLKVLPHSKDNNSVDCKYIFTDSDYQNRIRELIETGVLNRKNWIILPFFDVIESLGAHGAVRL